MPTERAGIGQRRLPVPQRVRSRSCAGPAPTGHGVDSWRGVRLRVGGPLRRQRPRQAEPSGRRHTELSARRARLFRAPGSGGGGSRRRVRQLRDSRPAPGPRVGAKERRSVRRRSEQRHPLRRIRRRHQRVRAAGLAGQRRALPQGHQRERALQRSRFATRRSRTARRRPGSGRRLHGPRLPAEEAGDRDRGSARTGRARR